MIMTRLDRVMLGVVLAGGWAIGTVISLIVNSSPLALVLYAVTSLGGAVAVWSEIRGAKAAWSWGGAAVAAVGFTVAAAEPTVDLLARSRASGRRGGETAAALAELTAREREVARCVARGRTNAEIADELVISLGTVKTHLGAITRQLGARNRVEVAAAMWSAGEMD